MKATLVAGHLPVENKRSFIKTIPVRFELPSSFTDELKNNYQKYFRRGFEIAIAIHLFIIGSFLFINHMKNLAAEENQRQSQQRIINVQMTDLEPPPSATEEEPPPPKIEEIVSPPPKDLTALTPEPVAKEKADIQTIKTQKELAEIKTPVSSFGDTGKFTYSGPVKIEEKKVEEKIVKEEKVVKEKEQTTYQSFEVERAPECVNLAQVRGSMEYPALALDAGIEGRVTVKVLVGPEGEVIKVSSITGPDVFYDEVRNKSMMLQFTPGLQNGKPVKVWVTVPFSFKLK
jgi:protein TonB